MDWAASMDMRSRRGWFQTDIYMGTPSTKVLISAPGRLEPIPRMNTPPPSPPPKEPIGL
jgi:hypothetical protein